MSQDKSSLYKPTSKEWAIGAAIFLAWCIAALAVLVVISFVIKIGVEYLIWMTTWSIFGG